MFSTIISAAILGMEVALIHVEVDIAQGLPGFTLVGYLSSEVKEAGERVRVALKNAGIALPAMRITVNLAPANVRKDGTAFDLPIAVGILEALGDIPKENTQGLMAAGELGLDGSVNPVRGVLPFVQRAKGEGIKRCLLPMGNYREGKLIGGIEIIGVRDLKEVMEYLKEGKKPDQEAEEAETEKEICGNAVKGIGELDFSQIKGQAEAKRAAEIAAAGFHNLLLIGPPGSGKTMIAKRIPHILPPLTEEESLEVSAVYSLAGLLTNENLLIKKRPFMAPHHTITAQALVGGGRQIKPGMVSLSHKGILFLDELPEFKADYIDMLRQPLEEKKIVIARLGGNYTFPADCMFVGAMNPCPCGYYPDMGRCRCTPNQIKRYQGRISGPVLDRIDLCAGVSQVTADQLSQKGMEEDSNCIRDRVIRARKLQEDRYEGKDYQWNAMLPQQDVNYFCRLEKKEEKLMEKILKKMKLSARAYYRILKVSRTIADLDNSEKVQGIHIEEALECRMGGERYWEM